MQLKCEIQAPQTTFLRVTAVHTTCSSFGYILAPTHCAVCTGALSAPLPPVTLSDSEQRVLARGRPGGAALHRRSHHKWQLHDLFEEKWPNVITELSTATENYIAFENAEKKEKTRLKITARSQLSVEM